MPDKTRKKKSNVHLNVELGAELGAERDTVARLTAASQARSEALSLARSARDGSDDTRSQAGVAAGGAEQDADVGPKCEPFGLPLFGTSGAGVHDVLEGLDGISIGLADEAGSLGEVAEVGDEESHNARRRVRHD